MNIPKIVGFATGAIPIVGILIGGITFGINEFGKSAPYKEIYKFFGLTSENIYKKIKKIIRQ